MGSEEEAYFTFVRESDNPFHQRTVFLSVEDLISSLLNKNQLRRPFALATKPVVNGDKNERKEIYCVLQVYNNNNIPSGIPQVGFEEGRMYADLIWFNPIIVSEVKTLL